MPELPEVETIRRDLGPQVVGRRITGLHVKRGASRLLLGVSQKQLRDRLSGRRIDAVGRAGKYLLFHLDDGASWVVHLRMTGSLRHRAQDAPPDDFLRAVVPLDDGAELRFTDIRKFGTFEVVDDVAAVTNRLGPEPLTPAFTEDVLATVVAGRQAPLKSVLLDQRRVAGLGNIYVDESLFLAGLHPSVPAGSLRAEECARLHAAIEQTLREGIAHRGASFRDYTDADGKDGNQQHFVRVFRRTGQPCDCCGGTIQRTVVGGRASHWCPRCQPARQARRKPRRRTRKDARAAARA